MTNKVYQVLQNKVGQQIVVESLTDFMFQEGWRVHHEVPIGKVDNTELIETKEYFTNLQYPKDN